MGFPVQTLALQKLPDQPDTLYVLTTDIPFGYNRIWNRVHDRIYKDNRLYLCKGVRIKEDEYNDERW